MKRKRKSIYVILMLFAVILFFFVSLHYLYLKKTLALKISEKTSEFIGQRVNVGNISFSTGVGIGINLHDIVIENPEGFGSGQLIKIKRLYLNMNLRELLKGRFYFKNIEIFSPELTIARNDKGRLNIADKFMQFLSKKTAIKYYIDEFRIVSGLMDFNRQARFRINSINLTFKDLSSVSSTKTQIKGYASHMDKNKIRFDGWAYLNDEQKKFNISVLSEGNDFSVLSEILRKYKIDSKQAKINMSLNVDGDAGRGFSFKSSVVIQRAGFYLLKKELKDVKIVADAFYDMKANSIRINNITLNAGNMFDIQSKGVIEDLKEIPSYNMKIKIVILDLSELNFLKDLKIKGIISSDDISIKGRFDKTMPVFGKVSVYAKNISISEESTNKQILKDAALNSDIKIKGNNLEFKSNAAAGSISATFSGTVNDFLQKEMSARIRMTLPQVAVKTVRDSFWDIFPDKLLYAGLSGSVSSDVLVSYDNNGIKVSGNLMIRDLVLEGENKEYYAGPVNGVIPIAYTMNAESQKALQMPLFELSEFNNLIKYYSHETEDNDYSKVTIGALIYGFRFLDNIDIWIKQEGSFLNISRFSANIFGGRLNGSAVFNFSDGIDYRAGILIKGLSLTKLCEDIEPIKGYITGKVDGITVLKGKGIGISGLIGKADFWTYSSGIEKTKISRELLQKIGGASLKTYLGDRYFDKGKMSLYLQNGFIIFKELEISNRNLFRVTDLSIKVAPLNNRISIDHLMWTVTEAAQRAKENK